MPVGQMCRPFGTAYALTLPGTAVPGYRLFRPFGTRRNAATALMGWPSAGTAWKCNRVPAGTTENE